MTAPHSGAAGPLPDRAEAQAHLLAGRFDQAAAAFRALIAAEPFAPNLRYDLGAALSALGDKDAAADAWGTARVFHGLALLRELGVDMDRFAVDPAYVVETGRGLSATGLPGVAAAALARALETLGPQPQLLADYAVCLLHLGVVDEACEVLAMADGEAAQGLTPLLLAAYGFHDDGGLRRGLLARQAASHIEQSVTPRQHAPRTPHAPLRIGYVAGASRLDNRFLAVMARHDPDAVNPVILVEDDDAAPDGFTAYSLSGLSDEEAAEAVAAFDFDLLVDLAGPSGGRMGLFAHRPAPAQLSWCLEMATTGLGAIDAKLVPAGCVERDAPMLFSEALEPMGPVLAPWPRVALEARPEGRFTFGAFMAPALMNAEVTAAIAAAVTARPDARLMIKHAVMDDPVIQRLLSARFLACGLSRDRIDFRGVVGPALDQADFDEVDLALDGRPSMGEAQLLSLLNRGTPVLCVGGPTTLGRLAAAPMAALGLQDLVVDSLDALSARAAALSQDRAALAALRARIEAAFETSAYGDTARVARDLEAAFARVAAKASVKAGRAAA